MCTYVSFKQEIIAIELTDHSSLYLEDDSGERSISLQPLWGGNSSLGTASQLLDSLAHHTPEPVRHQGGREVTAIQ